MSAVLVRPIVTADAEVLTRLIAELNRHQGDPVEYMTRERLLADAFGDDPWFEGQIAERGGEAVGYALFHRAYETGYAARGYYVQDLYVAPAARRAGVGRALIAAIATLAHSRGASFLWWTSKAWNTEAHTVYAQWHTHDEPVLAHALFGEAFERLLKPN